MDPVVDDCAAPAQRRPTTGLPARIADEQMIVSKWRLSAERVVAKSFQLPSHRESPPAPRTARRHKVVDRLRVGLEAAADRGMAVQGRLAHAQLTRDVDRGLRPFCVRVAPEGELSARQPGTSQ